MAFRLAVALVKSCGGGGGGAGGGMKKWAYNLAGFNQYGLCRDDILYDQLDPDVIEALRRLPDHIQDERNYRLTRAIQLSITKRVLPENEWLKYEDDHFYLSPIVEEVKKERLEREKWEEIY